MDSKLILALTREASIAKMCVRLYERPIASLDGQCGGG